MSAEPARIPVEGLSPFWVFTASGTPFDYDNPQPSMIDDRALAWQLSGEGRWANNTHFHLSVAQHSLLVASLMPRPEWRIYGLLHDAAEAFTRDLPTPFKHWLSAHGADVVALEARILSDAVLPHFGLPEPWPELKHAVDAADAKALATEYRDVVMGKGPEWVPRAQAANRPVCYQNRIDVFDAFLTALPNLVRDAHKASIKRAA